MTKESRLTFGPWEKARWFKPGQGKHNEQRYNSENSRSNFYIAGGYDGASANRAKSINANNRKSYYNFIQ